VSPPTDDDIEVEIDLSDVDPDYDGSDEEPVDWEEAPEHLAEALPTPRPKLELTPERKRLLREIRRRRMMTFEQLDTLPPTEWFVEGVCPLGMTVVHGAGGSFKSFLLLDWMLHADQSMTWHGRNVRPGKCLYVAGEGAAGISRRVHAWRYYHHVTARCGLTFMAAPINLFKADPDSLEVVAELVAIGNFDYVVVDTLHTASYGADENSSKDIGVVFENARQLAAGAGATLFFVHHDPKVGKTARGSSSIRDDSDVVLGVVKDESIDLTGTLSADKIRDEETYAPMTFHLEKVTPPNRKSSLVIESIDGNHNPLTMQRGQRILNAVGDNPGSPTDQIKRLLGISGSDWKKQSEELLAEGKLLVRNGPNNAKLWYLPGDEPEDDE
jgi:hypothetical protein